MLHVLPLVTYTEGKSGQIKHSGYIQYTYTKLHLIITISLLLSPTPEAVDEKSAEEREKGQDLV